MIRSWFDCLYNDTTLFYYRNHCAQKDFAYIYIETIVIPTITKFQRLITKAFSKYFPSHWVHMNKQPRAIPVSQKQQQAYNR